ncbi:hypothetical protein M7I_4022 [Glarea lozoyensis 74030]|uniref:Uncharacterized protein n=1 Tax=Glarea lozoyensis (strain ATCC 74030 / MF5533) TaxID=1104152 RepID=H0EN22_GLAL7|nr:hypothetical protein M7I_4022 [Glarea lozoyensis 74030]
MVDCIASAEEFTPRAPIPTSPKIIYESRLTPSPGFIVLSIDTRPGNSVPSGVSAVNTISVFFIRTEA